MQIKRIKISNFKTYLDLDLDLEITDPERPIILIGGMNGGGKTTLFEAIYGALYGLKIKSESQFNMLLNSGAAGHHEPKIELELTFMGKVLSQEQVYVLRRTYILNAEKRPVESVRLNMNGTIFTYGTATPPAKRIEQEAQVNKIIKANLPQELSRYFLFDAMEAGNLLKEDQLNRVIKENIENVMGFNKYQKLSRAAEKLARDFTAQRIQVENEQKEYLELVEKRTGILGKKRELEDKLEEALQYSSQNRELYERLKEGRKEEETLQKKIESIDNSIDAICKRSAIYRDDLEKFVTEMELGVFIPKLISVLSNEVLLILKSKNENAYLRNEQISSSQLRLVTERVADYLRYRLQYTGYIDLEDIGEYIVSEQHNLKENDPYEFLDETETEALKLLMEGNYNNIFPQLSQNRKELDISIHEIPSLERNKEIMRQQLNGKDYSLIKAYEENEGLIENLQTLIRENKSEIERIEKKIHQYDIQIQQEPDPKYDTLIKLQPFFDRLANELLKIKKQEIEIRMKDYLNVNLTAYKNVIGRVELSEDLKNLTFRIFHKSGNEIVLNQLNAGSKQLVIQVLLKVLHELGDYDPPVMIDTVMGVLDKESRETIMENYFPELSDQTILLSTDTEIRTEDDYKRLEPFISKTYTLKRDRENQCTEVTPGYFGITLNT